MSTEKHGTCASRTDHQELRFFGVSLLRALTVEMLSPVSVYVDKFFRIGVKGNVLAVMSEMLHPSVKKYFLLTGDSLWPMSPERGSVEIRVIPLFQSTCMTGGDSGCGRLRNRGLLVLLNDSMLSSLRSTMDVWKPKVCYYFCYYKRFTWYWLYSAAKMLVSVL